MTLLSKSTLMVITIDPKLSVIYTSYIGGNISSNIVYIRLWLSNSKEVKTINLFKHFSENRNLKIIHKSKE